MTLPASSWTPAEPPPSPASLPISPFVPEPSASISSTKTMSGTDEHAIRHASPTTAPHATAMRSRALARETMLEGASKTARPSYRVGTGRTRSSCARHSTEQLISAMRDHNRPCIAMLDIQAGGVEAALRRLRRTNRDVRVLAWTDVETKVAETRPHRVGRKTVRHPAQNSSGRRDRGRSAASDPGSGLGCPVGGSGHWRY